MRWLLRLVAVFAAFVFLAALVLLAFGGWSGRGRNAAAIDLQAKPDVVFAHLVQPELLQAWLGDLQKSEPLTPGGPKVGAKSKETVGSGDAVHELEVEITKLEANKLLALRITHAEFRTQALYAVKDKGSHTTLIYESTSQYHHPASRLLSPIVTRLAQRKLENDLLRLKGLLEAKTAPEVIAAAEAKAAEIAEATPVVDPAMTSSDTRDAGTPEVSSTPEVATPEAPKPVGAGPAPDGQAESQAPEETPAAPQEKISPPAEEAVLPAAGGQTAPAQTPAAADGAEQRRSPDEAPAAEAAPEPTTPPAEEPPAAETPGP